ncbi:MAG: hypothetical protein ACRD3W_04500 [Terriglobales bacterium]
MLLAKDPDIREPVRAYLGGRLFESSVANPDIREHLAWGVVEALQEELERTYRTLGLIGSAPKY